MSTFSGAFTQGGQTQLHTFRMIAQVVAAPLKIALWVFDLKLLKSIAYMLFYGYNNNNLKAIGYKDI